jgi:Zn-dependent peptidase ImmA (M78 family)
MITLDRMGIADIGADPVRIAREVLVQTEQSSAGLTLPIPVEEIARAAGISEIKRVDATAFEGMLVHDSAKQTGVIAVNRKSSVERKRFTVGHELGHFLHQFSCTKNDLVMSSAQRGDRHTEREVEANLFAAELLMPDRLVGPFLQAQGSPKVATILALHRDYGVSKEAAARRFVSLHREPCAVVFSLKGVVRGLSRGGEFPFIGLRRDDAISPTSATKRFLGSTGDSSDQEEAVLQEWKIDAGGGSLWEEVLVQQDGYRLTLLVWEPEDAETADEDRSWVPRFR